MITMSSMQRFPGVRTWRIIAAALAVALLLASCGTLRLAYGQADELAYWWLDGHVDFDSEQTRQARDGIAHWFAWHRRSQLPEYATLLERAAADAAADTTPERACAWFTALRERADTAVRQALPAAARVVVTLRPEQLEQLARKHAEVADAARADYLQPDAAERRAAALKRAADNAERVYGRLDAAQRERIAETVAASPFDAERWLAERLRRQNDLRQALAGLVGTSPSAAEAALADVWRRVQRSPDEGYQRYAQALERYNCEAAARLHNSTSAAQRAVAQQRLRDWQADLRLLAAAR
jgi:hypothetical protein